MKDFITHFKLLAHLKRKFNLHIPSTRFGVDTIVTIMTGKEPSEIMIQYVGNGDYLVNFDGEAEDGFYSLNRVYKLISSLGRVKEIEFHFPEKDTTWSKSFFGAVKRKYVKTVKTVKTAKTTKSTKTGKTSKRKVRIGKLGGRYVLRKNKKTGKMTKVYV